jgi:hypothetical protein
MGNRIDDNLVPLDAVDDPVREDLQVAGEWRAQARKSEQELNGMVHSARNLSAARGDRSKRNAVASETSSPASGTNTHG